MGGRCYCATRGLGREKNKTKKETWGTRSLSPPLSLSPKPSVLTRLPLSPPPSNLGIDDQYFREETVEVIGNHITALYGAKVLAFTKQNKTLDIDLEQETRNGAVFIHNSRPGVSSAHGRQIEQEYV